WRGLKSCRQSLGGAWVWRSGSGAIGGGGGVRAPALLRKESWTKGFTGITASSGGGGNGGPGGSGTRSESPIQMDEEVEGAKGKRKKDLAGRGLGLVGEEREEGDPARQDRVDGLNALGPPPLSASSTASFRSASAQTPQPSTPATSAFPSSQLTNRSVSTASTVPSLAPSTTSTATATPSNTASSGSGGKKKGIFSRFSRSGRSVSVSSTLSRGAPMSPPLSAGSTGTSEFGWVNGSPSSSRIVEGGKKGKEDGEKIRFPKVKAKGKSTKDFSRLFLAQELFIPPPPPPLTSASGTSGIRPTRSSDEDDPSTPLAADNASQHSRAPTDDGGGGTSGGGVGSAPERKKKNAVWAIKFSDDGKYLAVGGKDGVVRVWEVLSSSADRNAAMYPTSTFHSQPESPPATTTGAPESPPAVPGTPASFASASTTNTTPTRKKSYTGPARTGTPGTTGGGRAPVSVMPVFQSKPVREFRGHEADVLDLSWSKNNFLLSSSMDKTVRLWHVSRSECLCAFQHLDFVTSIAFHPKDDRFFLSGSLDCKLRLWNIPEKRVHVWTELPELITSVSFTRDGKLAIAGSFVGICMFFECETFHYHSQFASKSSSGKNSKGKKVTSLCAFPLPSSMGERLLVTTNDSRMRLYHTADKVVECKYAGHENTSSQIRASFSDDGRFIISGSEDRHVYIWDSGLVESQEGSGAFGLMGKKKKDASGYECFP
ncbi:hypothetical protein JCM11641_004410, partial [Rhodosporidiobolus odoratus]